MEINVKALPGAQVSVLNYRCKPAVWEPGFDVFGEYAAPVWVILWVSIISGTLSLGAYILLKYSEWRNK